MARLTKTQQQSDMPWDFSEVPKLVTRLLAEAFAGHPFKVRRNKSEQSISISWELGPTYDEVYDFVWKTFPRIGFDSDWGNREYDPPEMIEGRMLNPYFYSTSRLDLFNAEATDVPRLMAAGANIEERNKRRRTPFEYAVIHKDESLALALWKAGADCSSCMPDGNLYGVKATLHSLCAALESEELAGVMNHGKGQQTSVRRL